MKNVILLTFMSFLCLATTYAEHGDRERSRDRDRSSYDDSRSDYTNSRNSEYITYDGGDDYRRITLVDLEEVWGTETRQVRSTCTRRVPVTRRVCRDVRPGYGHGHGSSHHSRYDSHEERSRGHGRGHGRGHSRPPRRVCHDETTYRTESYTCYKTETVRVRRPDRRFHANVEIEFKNRSENRYSYGRADLIARLDKSVVSLELQGQNPRGANLFFMKDELRTSSYGDVTEISGRLKVLVFDKDEFLAPVNKRMDIRNEVHHGELVLKTGKIVFEKGLGLSLNIQSDYGHRSLFKGEVPRDFITVREGRYGEESIVIVDLDRLLRGTLRRGERVRIDATLSLMKRNLTLLNFRHVPQLEQTTSASVSIR